MMRALILTFLLATAASAETTFDVIHKRSLWPDKKGTLRIGEGAIEFSVAGGDPTRRWAYHDIQFLDRLNPTEIVLLSYADITWQLGRDKRYHFVLVSGELSESDFKRISQKIAKPAVNRSFSVTEEVLSEIPVKHRHRFGGCEGQLRFTASHAYYDAGSSKHSREWLLSRDVDSVWSGGPYRLELHVREAGRWNADGLKIYEFDLKKPLDGEFYQRLKKQLHGL